MWVHASGIDKVKKILYGYSFPTPEPGDTKRRRDGRRVNN